ncbi:HAD domain-containing protein [Hamadaea sp. NPDC051192]|uniref:HAD domain-containing protein n=1 Tax=Hamadaea sp. NPDC051192 TaxID=3154940 RepID=UPI00343ADB18
MPSRVRPVVFLDVDGVLLPFGGTRPAAPILDPAEHDHPLLHRLDRSLGPLLLGLDADLVWATTWMADANDLLAPRLGLPPLPVVDFLEDDDPGSHLHWKTRALVAWAGDRPFAWLDDEFTDVDRDWIEARHTRPALAYKVASAVGLTRADLDAVARWLDRVSSG